MPISTTTANYSFTARATGMAKYADTFNPTDLVAAEGIDFIPVGISMDGNGDKDGGNDVYNFRSYLVFKLPFTGTSVNKQTLTSATLNLKYETATVRVTPTDTTANRMPVYGNNGTRTLQVYRTNNTFTASTSGSNCWEVAAMTVTDTTRSWAGAMLQYDTSTVASVVLSGTIADNTVVSIDVMPLIRKIAPTYIDTPLGAGLNTSPAASGEEEFCFMLMIPTTQISTVNCANFATGSTGDVQLTIVSTLNIAPLAPTPTAPANGSVLTTATPVSFSATYNDQTGDAPTKFDLQISEFASFSKKTVDTTVNDSVIPLDTTIALSTFKPNAKYYWRIRAYDLANAVGAWSAVQNFTTPSVTGWVPTTVESTQVTPPRNKYRLEFYPLLTSLNGFDPNPCAVIFDAKAIGISHTVNSVGEFFFTLQSDHAQISKVVPQKTFWRACRWDDRVGYYRVIGEGIVTNSEITPHEVIFYGVDKLGILNRTVVSADKIASGTSHTGTISSIHDTITRSTATAFAGATAGVVTTGNVQFTATAHTFLVGDSVLINTITSGTQSVSGSYIKTVTSKGTNAVTVPSYLSSVSITAATRNSPASGQVTYTTATNHGFSTGMNATVTNIGGVSTYNFSNLPITVLSPTTFWATVSAGTGTPTFNSASVILETNTATITPLKRTANMGWGETPADTFSSYTVVNSAYSTATTSKQVQIAGEKAADALAAVADILMAGTSNKVILENPNIGQPANKIDEMNTGLQYRHLKVTDIVKPAWWFQYGVNIKNFTVQDNLNTMATKAIVINRNLDSSTTSLYNNGTADASLYSEYGLIEQIEIINEERNDIEFSAQLQYNLHPDRLFTITSDVIPNTVSPFANYAVGDDITVYIVHNRANIKKDLTIVGQRWVGNSAGAEFLMFMFSPRITQEFLNKDNKKSRRGRVRGGEEESTVVEETPGRGRGGGGGGDWTGGDNPVDPLEPTEPTRPEDIWYDGPWS